MSVHSYKTKDGTHYEVRWREGGRARSRSFLSKREANEFDVRVKARKLRGEPIPRPGRDTLAAVYAEWRKLRAPLLATKTRVTYEAMWNAHIKDRHDHHTLAEWVSNPKLFEELTADLRERGVGDAAQRKVLVVLSSMFKAAVAWNKVGVNPVLAVPKPPAARKRHPQPFSALVIERIRRLLLMRSTKDPVRRNYADACLLTLMSYAGLRPGEALALRWDDIGTKTVRIDKAISVGEEGPTKTGAIRSVPLVREVIEDLDMLRLARGTPAGDRLVFPGNGGADPWSPSQYNNWRNRVWKPAVRSLADAKPPLPRLATAVPYDCRGSFVSLHLRAGASPLEVARWAGHSAQVMFASYANVIDELVGEPIIPVSEQIVRARAAVEEMETQALDKIMALLAAYRTLSAAERAHDAEASQVARRFYRVEPTQPAPVAATAQAA